MGLSKRHPLQADTNNSQLFARNALSGKLVWSAGSTGLAPGQFTRIWGISPGAGGVLLATDAGNRVQLFTKAGHYVRQWITVQPGTTDAAPSRGIAFDPGVASSTGSGGSSFCPAWRNSTVLLDALGSASPGLLFDHLTVDGRHRIRNGSFPEPSTGPSGEHTGTRHSAAVGLPITQTGDQSTTATLALGDGRRGRPLRSVSTATNCSAGRSRGQDWTLPAGEVRPSTPGSGIRRGTPATRTATRSLWTALRRLRARCR
jgi:hypothetical protein